jgi:hypothetical protein
MLFRRSLNYAFGDTTHLLVIYKMSSLKPSWLPSLFWGTLTAAVVILCLRGFAILTIIPGAIVSGLWIVAISLGIYLAIVSLR